MSAVKYRPEIDGLRAIALIPVILFHAGFTNFAGGYVGVDVFFVISGYLITMIILTEMKMGVFSLANFYERRCRRILPALSLVMLISSGFSWWLLFPSDFTSFARSLAAVSTFSSNFLFWSETGYWGTANEMKPLLHTWSLAVEEQYYILFPLFMLLMWKYQKRWVLVSFVILALISLIMAHWGAYHKPSATFFLLPTRGWEIALGAIIAFYQLNHRKKHQTKSIPHTCIDEIFGITGLIMIGFSVYAFKESTPFPSLYALLPTVGTALIILHASPSTSVGYILGSRLFVGVGLISYSAYLWHQPLFAFARHHAKGEVSALTYVVLILLSLILAFMTYHWVERPFRNRNNFTRRKIFLLAATSSATFIFIGLASQASDGFGDRMASSGLSYRSIEEKWKVNYGLSKKCEKSFNLAPECRTDDSPEILVWGDSFAMHTVNGILASNPDARIIQMTKSVCGPFFDISPVTKNYHLDWAEGCLDFTDRVRNWLRENRTVDYVVLSSPFTHYISQENSLLLRDGRLIEADIDIAKVEFERTLNELKAIGITSVIISPPPTDGTDLGQCLAHADRDGVNLHICDYRREDIIKSRQIVYTFLKEFEDNTQIIRLEDIICDGSLCKASIDSTYIYRDKSHLSHEGSAILGKAINLYKTITTGNSPDVIELSQSSDKKRVPE